jgi:Cu-processing system permease protein
MSVILRKELRDAVHGRWLAVYAVAFALLAFTLALVDRQAGELGSQGFNRTTAGLINLSLLIAPLLALIMGAGAIAGERERGTLVGLLAQPLSTTELLVGKYLGLLFAVWLALAAGFGAAALLVAAFNPLTDAGHYLLFVALSAGLAAAMLSIGMLISVVSERRVRALALAVGAWFLLVLFYDLGAIGLALAVSSSGRTLLLTVLGNPVETVRILAILSLEPDLQVLGPLGAYLSTEFGTAKSAIMLLAGLLFWTVAPLVASVYLFRRQDA